MSMAPLYLALLHYPIYNKHREIVTTAVTNMDIHDIARTGRTYGVRRFYVVTPVEELRQLAATIVDHWETGHGATYNANRREALAIVALTEDLDRTIVDVERDAGAVPQLIATSAQMQTPTLTYEAMRHMVREGTHPLLILFGTGWGLTETTLERADHSLPAITGPGSYNHLSVRAAAAITLDRVCGAREEEARP